MGMLDSLMRRRGGKAARRRNLVIVRAPNGDTHVNWVAQAPERDWDLVLSVYQETSADCADGLSVIRHPGFRWPAIVTILRELGRGLGGYEYIWLIPDDVLIKPAEISAIFRIMKEYELGLAQPALTYDSYFSHPVTLLHSRCRVRFTDFVEIMVPCFRADVLERALPLIERARFGWGMDWVWTRYAGEGRCVGIIDAVTVRHWRPFGGELSKLGTNDEPRHEMRRTLMENSALRTPGAVFRVIDSFGRLVTDPNDLLQLLQCAIEEAIKAGLREPQKRQDLTAYLKFNASIMPELALFLG
jgi:hypothetical protein